MKKCITLLACLLLTVFNTHPIKAETVKDSTIVIKAMVEEGVNYNIYAYMQFEDDQDNGYSWTLSSNTGYEIMDSIPAGTYIPDAMFAGNFGGTEYWTYVDPTPMEVAPDETTYINIVAGTKEFVSKYKALAYDVSEDGGAIKNGSISEKEANKQLKEMGSKALEFTTEKPNDNPTVFVINQKEEKKDIDIMRYVKITISILILIGLFVIMHKRNKQHTGGEKE